jgi:hypothetical protein
MEVSIDFPFFIAQTDAPEPRCKTIRFKDSAGYQTYSQSAFGGRRICRIHTRSRNLDTDLRMKESENISHSVPREDSLMY